MCSSLMDHNESPGSTTKRVVAEAPFSSSVVLFCSASTEAVGPVSSWASSWALAMPGSTARIDNAASTATTTPATTIPTCPLSLVVLKMLPPYSERHFPCPKPKAGAEFLRCPLKKGAPLVRRELAWQFGYQPGGRNESKDLARGDRGDVPAREGVQQRQDGQKLEAKAYTRGAAEGGARGRSS